MIRPADIARGRIQTIPSKRESGSSGTFRRKVHRQSVPRVVRKPYGGPDAHQAGCDPAYQQLHVPIGEPSTCSDAFRTR